MDDLNRQQRKIDAIYRQQISIVKTGLQNGNGELVLVGMIKAKLIIEVMEALKLHSRSYCLNLRADLEELRKEGVKYG